MSDAITGLIRTWVPIAVGAFLSWLIARGVDLDTQTQAGLVTSLTGVVIAVYYGLVRLTERRWPWFGVLLGSTKQPTYQKTGELPPAE